MKVTTTDGVTFALVAECSADGELLDALDLRREVSVTSMQRTPNKGSYFNSGATLEISSTAAWALRRKAGSQALSALGNLQRFALAEAAGHSHVGADPADPQPYEALAASLEQLQLMLDACGRVVGENKSFEKVVGAHSSPSGYENDILAGPAAIAASQRSAA